MAALPFVFLTSDLHVISPTALENGQLPPDVKIAKHFLKNHVEEIKQEFFEVKSMGSAAAEEWLKGLEDRGKQRRNDAARWVRWEASGGLKRSRDIGSHGIQGHTVQVESSSAAPAPPVSVNMALPSSNAIPVFQSGDVMQEPGHTPNQTQLSKGPQPLQSGPHSGFGKHCSISHLYIRKSTFNLLDIVAPVPPRFDTPSQTGFSGYSTRNHLPARPERTKEEVAELRAARRSEIERRCMLLEPPIAANVLAHMTSFQAAMQIIKPLDDASWEILKPRLLSQREEAEQRERERLSQSRVVQHRVDERRHQDSQSKEAKDVAEKEWEDVQAPIRARIGGYADEIINEGWGGGDKVKKDSCGKFAAEVLIYIRKRFYAEVAKDDTAARAAGQEPRPDPPEGPYTRKLTLENMKWVFDTKIKPITEKYRKELFLCSVCDTNFKYYGFEGVIQHYAAKHTSSLSLGSIVVHWKAEWPEDPPFSADPTALRSTFYTVSNSNGSFPATAPPIQHTYGYAGYQAAPAAAPLQPQNTHVYQESPGPYYGHPQYNDQYMAHQHGPYAPPPPIPAVQQPPYMDNPSYAAPQYAAPPHHGQVQRYNDNLPAYPQQPYTGHYPPPSHMSYSQPSLETSFQQPVPDNNGLYPGYSPQGPYTSNSPPTYRTEHLNPASSTALPLHSPEYREQLLDIAHHAREIWNSITTVKEIPGSIRVYTIIYHILKRSRSRFKDDPPLAMLIDGLSNVKEMRPVRNINGLLCKACALGLPGVSTAVIEKKHFSLPQLVSHFHSVHETQDRDGPAPDWKKDMIELPDVSKVSGLAEAPGMDDQRLKLFAEALPEFFTSQPLPNIKDKRQGQVKRHYSKASAENNYAELAPSQDNHEKYYTITRENSEQLKRKHKSTESVAEGAAREPPYFDSLERDQDRDRHVVRYRQDLSDRRPLSPLVHQSRTSNEDDLHESYRNAIADKHYSYRLPANDDYRPPGSVVSGISRYTDLEPHSLTPDYTAASAQPYTAHESQPLPRSNRFVDDINASSYRDGQIRGSNNSSNLSYPRPDPRPSEQLQNMSKSKRKPTEAGSEDGEVRLEPNPKVNPTVNRATNEADEAAERFLNQFLQDEPTEEDTKKAEEAERQKEEELRAKWESERIEVMRRMYQTSTEPARPSNFDDDGVAPGSSRAINDRGDQVLSSEYGVQDHISVQQRPARAYGYDDRYTTSSQEQLVDRERSPELVDRRYKLNNVVYRDERQTGQNTRRTPSRYARYESVRLENDRTRSRSPVYVKMPSQSGHYRDRSPSAHPPSQDPVYHSRTSQPSPENISYERAPRQEYYRVYEDPRVRQPHYPETYEYVQVSDAHGEYVIRRPVRREPEPIYTTYQDDVYSRQPVYETRPQQSRAETVYEARAPISRSDPAYYEEYDPRHPAPPSQTIVRQVRYQ